MEDFDSKQEWIVSEGVKYAGFWIRFLALLIDIIILSIIALIFFWNQATEEWAISVSYNGWQMIIPILYILWFWIWKWATPWKMACGIKIIETDWAKLSWAKALVRYFSTILSALVFFIGFIWAAFDSKKQTWHDKIADTYVIKK